MTSRPIVIARYIRDGRNFLDTHPEIPCNALIVTEHRALQGLTVESVWWVDGWDRQRTPDACDQLRQSVTARRMSSLRRPTLVIDGPFPDLRIESTEPGTLFAGLQALIDNLTPKEDTK